MTLLRCREGCVCDRPPKRGACPDRGIVVPVMRSALLVVVLAGLASVAAAGAPTETLAVPGFGKVAVYAPPGTPREVVLFVSGDGGWNLGVVAMAERLRDQGALVAGIDIRAFLKSMEAGKGCAYPAGALE